MCVYARVYITEGNTGLYTYICNVYMSVFLSLCPCLSANLELTSLARLSDQGAPGTCLSASPALGLPAVLAVPTLSVWVLQTENSLCAPRRPFTQKSSP